jgi:nitrogen fixation NifU-like protein
VSDLTELYQSVILDHNRRPRNFGRLERPTCRAEGRNPLCGDQVTVTLELTDDVITDVRFEGHGCAIAKASASLMTAAVKGRTRAEAEVLFQRFHGLVLGQEAASRDELGQLVVFSGVSRFPVRVKCASLAWHTLRAALADGAAGAARVAPVSTE